MHTTALGVWTHKRSSGPCTGPHCLFVRLLSPLLSTVTYPQPLVRWFTLKARLHHAPCGKLTLRTVYELELMFVGRTRTARLTPSHSQSRMIRRGRNNLAHLPLETLTDVRPSP